MMDIVLAFGALALLCLFLYERWELPAALSPLAALSLIALWLTVMGMADRLRVGGYVLYILCAVLGGSAVVRLRRSPARRKALFSPGFVVFWGFSLFFAVYFSVRQPMFSDFDEFSFWGTAAKLTSLNDALYTTAEIGWQWQATQNPGLILLSYFVQMFGAFAPWKTFLAYDMLFFACFAAVLGSLRWKHYAVVVPAVGVCWCVPWFFTTYNRTVANAISGVYMSSYGDIPAGMVFGGAVAFWLWLRDSKAGKFLVLPVIMLCANIKSNTFVLSLVAAGLVAADHFLFPCMEQGGKWLQGVVKRIAFAVACMAAPMALYLGWNRYIAGLVAQNAAEGGMGTTSESIVTVAVSGIKILLGLPVGDYYTQRLPRLHQAAADMTNAFYSFETGRLSMIGPGAVLVVLILAVFAGAFVLAKGQRLRVGAAAVLSTGGFVGYNFMLVLSYAFIFKESQCAALVDYNRYLYTYYIGWFLIALACLAAALHRRESLLATLGSGALWLMAVAMLLRVEQLVLPQMSVLGFSQNYFSSQRLEQSRADAARAAMEPGARVFFVSQGDNGLKWFSYCYAFLPTIVDYSGSVEQGGGGGTFGLAELRPGEEDYNRWLYYHAYTSEELLAEYRDSGCDYLFLNEIDDIFIQSYSELFADGLAAARSGETLLYTLTEKGFEPVDMEVPQ